MTRSPGPTASQKAPERLSTAQTFHLMRLEVEKAVRYGYPISCVVIGLDRFQEGEASHRKAIMPAVFHELKAITFANDVRGLGIWTEKYQLAVFPHLQPDAIVSIADILLARARILEKVGGGLPITLSVGVSHNLHSGVISFESLVAEAETGMRLALEGGGDRVILAMEVESEIDQIREELEEQIQEIREHQKVLFGEEQGEEETWGKNLIAGTLELFDGEPDKTPAVLRLERAVMQLLTQEVRGLRESSTIAQLVESQRKIDMLERRVRKLTESLGLTEQELKRIAGMKNIDLGVASIYRSVQGLSADDDNAEQKKEMLKNIFEANVALRQQISA